MHRGEKSRISFSSVLGPEHREELEQLLFFNPQQRRALSGIDNSLREYGVPSIYLDDGDKMRIRLAGLPESQTLYALDNAGEQPVLAGVMVYSRVSHDTLVLLHIAVREDYSRTGKYADEMLVLRLTTQLRRIARMIRGVRQITLKYSSDVVIPVRS
jgi:hypothetical protein